VTVPPGTRGALGQAATAFHQVQKKARYKKSAIIKEWNRDFLSYPDLKAINRQYWKDRDALAFVAGTLRSPNFPKMLRKYGGSQDLQAFVKDLLQSPSVVSSGRMVLEDKSLMAAAKDLTIPGLPSVGTMMALGHGASASGGPREADGSVVLRELQRSNPALREVLETPGGKAPAGRSKRR
jgi:hypothetical protein